MEKVYNADKTKILDSYDLNSGYLKKDTILVHIDEVKEVKEQGHYDILKEYPNGGKEVKWIIDVPGVEYQPSKDTEEDILVYVEYTQKEKNIIKIMELKQLLAESDFRAIKYAEGEYTDEEYAPYREQRKAWRKEINELEEV